MTFNPGKFTLDSSIELVSDRWTTESPTTEVFRAADPVNDRINLSAGLITPAGSQTITALTDGFIDEYELNFMPTSVIERLRGRDQSALALDTYVNIQFRPSPPVPAVETNTTIPEADIRYGSWTAQTIAQTILQIAGLTLTWSVRDYTFVETFSAQGRVIDVLRILIQPWTLVTPFTADIYIQNKNILVQYRMTPPTLTFSPQYVFDIGMARRTGLTYRVRQLRKYGRVSLFGAKTGDGVAGSSPNGSLGGATFASGEETFEEMSEKFDEGGNLIQRVVTKTTVRTPERIPKKVIKSTFNKSDNGPLELTARETVEIELEDSVYGPSGALTQPKTLKKTTVTEGIDPGDDAQKFQTVAKEELNYDYDELGFLKYEGTERRKIDITLTPPVLVKTDLIEKTYHEQGPLMVNQIVETYKFDSDKQRWVIQSRDESLSGGHRAGGPNRGQSTAGLKAGETTDKAFKIAQSIQTISSDKNALPFSYSNPNLSQADLDFLMSMFVAASGIKEHELVMNGVAIPWVRRGLTIQFTNLPLETPSLKINTPACKVTEIQIVYDESKVKAEFLMPVIRAFAWSAT